MSRDAHRDVARTPVRLMIGPTPLDGTLVLGTDGLFKYCPHTALLAITRSPNLDEIPQQLLKATALPNGRLQDDVGVIVCRR